MPTTRCDMQGEDNSVERESSRIAKMTVADIQSESVQRVASECTDRGFAEAFMMSALKTAPKQFTSIKAAEEAGWTFNPGLGRWEASEEELRRLKEMEKYAKSLTSERVDAMATAELQQTLKRLSSEMNSNKESTSDETTSDEILREQVNEKAASVQHGHRAMRKYQMSEGPGQATFGFKCVSCGKSPGVGKRLHCARCRAVAYCGRRIRHCASWPKSSTRL